MFCKVRHILHRSNVIRKSVRTFLSENFKCEEVWSKRLGAPFMQNVNLDSLFIELDQKFHQQKKASAIDVDVDIFVNKLTDEKFTDEAADLLHNLRLTEEASSTLDSTSHAVVRIFLETGHVEELMVMLDNRLGYGVFLDHFVASYAMDQLIKLGDFKSAAQIAVQLMLQEDFGNELSRTLALYSCHRFLEKPEPFFVLPEADTTTEKEEVKVRVKFLRNAFFDDHFDLSNHNHLVGKTLLAISKYLDDDLSKNVRVLGEVLYQKYDAANETLQSVSNGLYKEIVVRLEQILESETPAEGNESYEKLKSTVTQLTAGPLKDNNITKQIESLVKTAVEKCEKVEVNNQVSIYNEWNAIREKRLNEKLVVKQKEQRLENIKKLSEDLKTEEQKLWFFENEEKIDLQIDSKQVRYPKRWFGKKKKPRVVDEGYIPPEI